MYSNSNISKGGVAMESVVQHSTFRRDSALAVYKVDDVNDEYLDAKPVVTYDDAVLKLEDDVDSNINVYTLKRAVSEEDDLLSEAPKQKKRTRKTKNREEKARVGCPFYKMDPKAHAQNLSCRGIGFSEMAKLKDHLKRPHGLTTEDFKKKLNFKAKRYTSLKSLGAKWKLVFHDLFPTISKDQVPSPYITEDFPNPFHLAVRPRGAEIDQFKPFLRNRLLNDLRAEDLATWFDASFNQAVQDWKCGVDIDDIKTTANNLPDEMKCIDITLDTLSLVGSHGCITSRQSSPYLSNINADAFSGLPPSPNVKGVDFHQSLHENSATWSQQHESKADLIPRGIQGHPTNCPPTSARDLEPTTGSVFHHTSNEFGTWVPVFVPHETVSKVDVPCAFNSGPSHGGEAVDSDALSPLLDRIDEPMYDADNTSYQLIDYNDVPLHDSMLFMDSAPAASRSQPSIPHVSDECIPDSRTILGPGSERELGPSPPRRCSVSSFDINTWITLDDPQSEIVEDEYNVVWFEMDPDVSRQYLM